MLLLVCLLLIKHLLPHLLKHGEALVIGALVAWVLDGGFIGLLLLLLFDLIIQLLQLLVQILLILHLRIKLLQLLIPLLLLHLH
jgi:hypothetical protein